MEGYIAPNFTQIPNLLLDEHLATMQAAELKVVLAICRQTFGWHKTSDNLSLSQLVRITGLSRQGVLNGIAAGMERGVIVRKSSGQSYSYSIVVYMVDQSDSELVNEVDQSNSELVNEVDRLEAKLVNEVDTQNKVVKENYLQSKENGTNGTNGTNGSESKKAGRDRDLIYEAVYWGLTGTEYQPGAAQPVPIANRIAAKLKEHQAAAEDVRAYYGDIRAKGMTPTRDWMKVVEGSRRVHALRTEAQSAPVSSVPPQYLEGWHE